MPINLSWDAQLVGCEYHARDAAIPEGQVILHLQEAQPHPVFVNVRVEDPVLAQEVISLWEQYSHAVAPHLPPKNVDGTPNPLFSQPWPEAPRLRLTLSELPTP